MSHTPGSQPLYDRTDPAETLNPHRRPRAATVHDEALTDRDLRDYLAARVGPPSLENERDAELDRRAATRRRSTRDLLGQPTPPVDVEPVDDAPPTPQPPNQHAEPYDEPDLCDVCRAGDGELPDDVVANYVDSRGTPHLAHPDCAESTGWRLA